jgi:hypothetical protein
VRRGFVADGRVDCRRFDSEMQLVVLRAGKGPEVKVTLRRTRAVVQPRVASDPERFRAYLAEKGFWLRTTSTVVDRQALRIEFDRCFHDTLGAHVCRCLHA